MPASCYNEGLPATLCGQMLLAKAAVQPELGTAKWPAIKLPLVTSHYRPEAVVRLPKAYGSNEP